MKTLNKGLSAMLTNSTGLKKALVPMVILVGLSSLNVYADDATELVVAAGRGDTSGVQSLIAFIWLFGVGPS